MTGQGTVCSTARHVFSVFTNREFMMSGNYIFAYTQLLQNSRFSSNITSVSGREFSRGS